MIFNGFQWFSMIFKAIWVSQASQKASTTAGRIAGGAPGPRHRLPGTAAAWAPPGKPRGGLGGCRQERLEKAMQKP